MINRRIHHRSLIAYLVPIMILGLFLTSCGLEEETFEPTGIPEPTITPILGKGSISGLVWEDQCDNYDPGDSLPSGCVNSSGELKYIGNGILDVGEVGVSSLQVSLGQGVCPSVGLALVETDPNGKFVFSDLDAGIYCVSVKEPMSPRGVWTHPKSDQGEGVGQITIALAASGIVENGNFGRDPLIVPPTPVPTVAPTPLACTDKADFVRDVTIPDGTRLDPGTTFSKTWRLRNSGTCTWTPQYAVVFVSGNSLQGATVISLTGEVPAGREVDISVPMQAPMSNGDYEGFWKLRNTEGDVFGIGEAGNAPFWLRISVGPKPEPKITDWRGEYYNNTNLSGNPTLVRNDKNIDFNWSNGSPNSDITRDSFSARWTRKLTFERGLYRFRLMMDDGAALWVDGRLVIDEWKQGASRERAVDLGLIKGEHELKVEFYEVGGTAMVRFGWEKLSNVSFNGWKGSYYFNKSMDSKWALVRDDLNIDFDWKSGSPMLGIPQDDFSVRWERKYEFDPGVYTFFAVADDGIRFYIGDALVIDEWHPSDGTAIYKTERQLSGIQDLTIQYYENKGQAKIRFWWERKNEPPVVKDDEYHVVTGSELSISAPGVLSNDSDADGDSLSVSLISSVTNGTLTLNGNGSFVYIPNAGFTGTDGFSYRISDGRVVSNVANVKIVVEPLNHIPEAVDDAVSTEIGTSLLINVLSNDLGLGDLPLALTITSQPENGIVEMIENQIRYTPNEDFLGIDTFEYSVADADGESSSAIVTITVIPEIIGP